jgi:hypothetical protein
MKKILLVAALAAAALATAAPASAAIVYEFTPGAPSPGAGYTVINTFDTAAGITGINFEIKVPPADGYGAPPANSVPAGTPYLSVLGGGNATITFAAPVTSFQFDWGSVDYYNTLFINWKTVGGQSRTNAVIPGFNFPSAANGNQVLPGTNGLFTVRGTEGETFTSIKLTSDANSFEIDNLAIPGVPEPTTWGLMIMGFGGIGAMLRRRRQAVAFA